MANSKNISKIFAEAIFLSAAGSLSLCGTEMSSKFSVKNFSKDQATLTNAGDSLRGYMIIATLWTLGTVIVMYGAHGLIGAVLGLLANLAIIIWVYFSYIDAFKHAAENHKLQMPVVFNTTLIAVILAAIFLSVIVIAYVTPGDGVGFINF
jgi:hypothetical protein